MVHKIGQNLISDSAPCQHFILSSSMACEPAGAFPIQSLQRNEKPGGEDGTGEKRSGSVPSLSSMALQVAEETHRRFLVPQRHNHVKQDWQDTSLCPKKNHIREGLLTF